MPRYVFLVFCSAILGLVLPGSDCWAKIVNVPGDQPTIQKGIDFATNGDTVEVSPGSYSENINFNGKLITVTSTSGSKVTIIDGHKAGPVVTFSSKETPSAILSGFTITNGSGVNGGGIFIQLSSPTISGNIITNNEGCGGGGIGVLYSSPIIKNNLISNNVRSVCTGSNGGGIQMISPGSAQILSNVISNNSCTAGDGGGIWVLAGTKNLLIGNNLITGNAVSGVHSTGPDAAGGGVDIDNGTLVQNLIVNNTADIGGGVYFAPNTAGSSSPGATLVNNTIAANIATQAHGSAVYADFSDAAADLFNNLLIGSAGQSAVFCNNSSSVQPIFQNNDAFSAGASPFEGGCAGEVGKSGNISEEPTFVNAALENFRFLAGSPGIDVGLNSAPDLSATDLDGLLRIVDGSGKKTFIIDMGAYEFQPVTVTPTSLSFGKQVLGSHTNREVTLTNHQSSALSVSTITAGGDFSATNSCPSSVQAGTSCAISVDFVPTAIGPRSATLTINDSDTNGPRKVPLSGIGELHGTPTISNIPGTILVGSTFNIVGTDFTAGSKVNFFVSTAGGPVNAGPLTPIAQTTVLLTVAVPDSVTLGQGFASVEVVNTDTGYQVSNPAYALLQGAVSAGIPTLKTINGTGLAATSSNPDYAINNAESVVPQGMPVQLGGTGFDVVNGVAVDLFCACPVGKVGPFFLNPGSPGLSPTSITFTLPATGANAPSTGPGSFLVSNAGASKTYGKKSNAVSVPIGARITVTSVSELPAIPGRAASITVTGTGFSNLTVINFFNAQADAVVNLGGLKADGTPVIPIFFVNDTTFTLVVPPKAVPGPSYVEALNPPFLPFTATGTDPGGSFVLK